MNIFRHRFRCCCCY